MHVQLIDLAYGADPLNYTEVVEAFDRAIRSTDLPDDDKLTFSQRKLEFLEDLSNDIDAFVN